MYLKHVFSPKSRRHLSKTILSSFFVSFFFFIFNQTSFATTWYRYYDRQGVPLISTSVSPEHIRNGYDVLNGNMELIQKVPALQNTEISRQKREQEAEQDVLNEKVRQIYTHSNIATKRKNNLLRGIQDKIALQRKQYDSLQGYLRDLRHDEFELLYRNKIVPKSLKNNIEQTTNRIRDSQKKMNDLQTQYEQTEQQYDKIINRLKKLEER
ncbi:hypothetical protein OZX61_02695 [Acinetobacter sp. ESL0695]|uniref:DUF4124 domain-containing protein n=1 Tax=Acinetobacter pollinis TaxID=2605270 RepID=A0ABU6DW04_9GAMM|nr:MULTISPECIES: hypothetical protein [Acinetobacter]MEB5477651.1 hypothetical protein [Acinetobacter pollinis]WEV49409.1 hypothetical protein OZX61_02695 [Acinetobacter sp. ESL0695]